MPAEVNRNASPHLHRALPRRPATAPSRRASNGRAAAERFCKESLTPAQSERTTSNIETRRIRLRRQGFRSFFFFVFQAEQEAMIARIARRMSVATKPREDGLVRTDSCARASCGVNWTEEQASLDCAECGGYALHRPCVHCNGICGGVSSRDLVASHKFRRSQWIGECDKPPQDAAVAEGKDS
ncbi:hypothetical protein MRX96_024063 [Rhipicephalus microplus]